jgi:hypothetical protein
MLFVTLKNPFDNVLDLLTRIRNNDSNVKNVVAYKEKSAYIIFDSEQALMEAYEHRYKLLEVAPEISHVHRPLVSAICYIGNLYFRLDSELTIFKSLIALYVGGIEYIEIIENKNVKRARRYTDTRIASAYIYKCQGIDPITSITNVLEEFRVVLNSPRMTVTKYIGKTAQRIIYLNVRSIANVERITDALIDSGIRRCCVELVKKRSGQAAYCYG